MNTWARSESISQVFRLANVFKEGFWSVNFWMEFPTSIRTSSLTLIWRVSLALTLRSTSIDLAVLLLHLKSWGNVSAWSFRSLLLETEVVAIFWRIWSCLDKGRDFSIWERPYRYSVRKLVRTIDVWTQWLIIWNKRAIGTGLIEGCLVFASRILSYLSRSGKVWSFIRTHLLLYLKLMLRISSIRCCLAFCSWSYLSIRHIQRLWLIWLEPK